MIKSRWKRVSVFGVVVAACLLGWFLWDWWRVADYEVVYLPIPAGAYRTGVAVNDFGQVVGETEKGPFVWDEENGLVEIRAGDGETCRAAGINNQGEVVGSVYLVGSSERFARRAFVWRANTGMVRLEGPGGENSSGKSINSYGQVAGVVWGGEEDPNGVSLRLFVWDEKSGMEIVNGIAGQIGRVNGINDAGEVVGTVREGGKLKAFVWSRSGGYEQVKAGVELGEILGIDSDGNVTGQTVCSDESVIFRWNRETGMEVVDTLRVAMPGICNDRGDVAGWMHEKAIVLFGKYRIRRSQSCVFVLKRNGRLARLRRLRAEDEVFFLSGINNDGWITGSSAKQSTKEMRPVLLKPK